MSLVPVCTTLVSASSVDARTEQKNASAPSCFKNLRICYKEHNVIQGSDCGTGDESLCTIVPSPNVKVRAAKSTVELCFARKSTPKTQSWSNYGNTNTSTPYPPTYLDSSFSAPPNMSCSYNFPVVFTTSPLASLTPISKQASELCGS